MRATRSIMGRRSRSRLKGVWDLNLVSLIDILVILLVFLLKTLDTSAVSFYTPEGLVLPRSVSPIYAEDGLSLHVSTKEIAIDTDQVIIFEEGSIQDDGTVVSEPIAKNLTAEGGRLIVPLYEALKEKKEAVEAVVAQTGGTPFSGKINLVADKRLNYALLKRIIYTAAAAEYITLKFSVQKREGSEAMYNDTFQAEEENESES
jgi:biopolymer transport protein ExbD